MALATSRSAASRRYDALGGGMGDELREWLAALEHEQWVAWSQEIAKTEVITPARLAHWEVLWGPYDTLTESQKDQDREWADRVLAIIDEETRRRGNTRL